MNGMMPAEKGFALWLTGRPASGKSTLARELRRELWARGMASIIIDSDELRAVLTPAPTYSDAERDWFYDVVGSLTIWLTEAGVNTIIAATGNLRRYRDRVRQRVPRFAEAHVLCDESQRRARDWKGLYALVDSGLIENLPGVDAVYEPPVRAEATVDTTLLSPTEAAQSVLAQLQDAGLISMVVPEEVS